MYFETDSAGAGSAHLNLNTGRINLQGANANAVEKNMFLSACPEPYRAVNACAGIPTGVRLVSIAGNYGKFIFTGFQMRLKVYIKIGISIGAGGNLCTVEKHLGVMVDALKLQNEFLSIQLGGDRKCLFILVIPAFEPAYIALADTCADAAFGAHGIMGEKNGNCFTFTAQRTACPAGIEIISLHRMGNLLNVFSENQEGQFSS